VVDEADVVIIVFRGGVGCDDERVGCDKYGVDAMEGPH
jgi:hypothetical protein